MEEKLLLLRPDERLIAQYEDYKRDFLAAGDSMDGAGPLRRSSDGRDWLARLRLYEDPATLPAGLVLATQYILVRESDGRLLGMLQLRHDLNDYLLKYAGHIGYSVRPSERRKGYAKRMLAMGLDEARKLGLTRVLITCSTENEASRRTILANGGVFENTAWEPDDKEMLERYWIEL